LKSYDLDPFKGFMSSVNPVRMALLCEVAATIELPEESETKLTGDVGAGVAAPNGHLLAG
jgi:hypothetical protein